MSSPLRHARTAWLALAALVMLAIAVPGASAAPVTVSTLDWTQAAVYDTAAPANTDRTWLGYATGPGFLAAGTVTPSAGATGPTVTPSSPRGATALYTFSFPGTSGNYDAATNTGSVELSGTLTYNSTAHGFNITVENPLVVLNGTTGTLYASGTGFPTAGATPYDRSQPLFNLNLAGATISPPVDGTRTISNIVPSLATADYAFPANYSSGAGPERTPNTFGSFALTVTTGPDTPAPPAVVVVQAPSTGATSDTTPPASTTESQSAPSGTGTPSHATPNAATPATADAGLPGALKVVKKQGKRTVVVTLASAPGERGRTYRVRLTNAAGKTVATGTLKGRTLRLTERHGFKVGAGPLRLSPIGFGSGLNAVSITLD